MTTPDTARREALIAIMAEHTGLSDRTADLAGAADAILSMEAQALGEALDALAELNSVLVITTMPDLPTMNRLIAASSRAEAILARAALTSAGATRP